jgi:hypothetical protein
MHPSAQIAQKEKMVVYGKKAGRQPFTVVCRDACPYCKHIPIYPFVEGKYSTVLTKCQVSLSFVFVQRCYMVTKRKPRQSLGFRETQIVGVGKARFV